MRDPYQTLGVSRSADEAEIKSAYRKLAKKLHPDVNPGRKDVEQKFKEITAAYDLLSDPKKRARFDRGEIDAMGNDKGFSGSGFDPFANAARRGAKNRAYNYSFGGDSDPFSQMNAEDIFSEFFGGGKSRGFQNEEKQRGQDVTYGLTISFVEACQGCKKRVTLVGNKAIDVNIPPGTETGNKLRLRGQGAQGRGGSGDAIIEITVEPHRYFTRNGYDINVDLPISLPEAVTGASVEVQTLDGKVSVKTPKWANTGTTLRLKGKGVPKLKGDAGDMFVKLKIMLPENPDSDLSDIIEKWAKKKSYDPRKKST